MNTRPRKFGLDMEVRWNSTYLMLKHLLPYRNTFDVFIQTHYPRAVGEPLLLSDDHWYVAEKILVFLELFYDSTCVLSGVYYPTSSLMMHHIIQIAKHLNSYEHDRLLGTVVFPMQTKFLKYWRDIPLLYSFAFILDPRAKLRGFNRVLSILAGVTHHDYSGYLTLVRAQLTEVFNKYEAKFGAVPSVRPSQTTRTGKKRTNWGMIYGDDDDLFSTPIGGTGSSSNPTPSASLSRHTSASALLQAASNYASLGAGSELSAYLDSDTVQKYDDDFNLLTWWQDHKLTYPSLSMLAKDVLTVPVSTISSESAFSLTGRIIEERRRRLTSEMVEMLTCIKDWEEGNARTQHTVENKELEDSFSDLYLDDEQVPVDTPGSSHASQSQTPTDPQPHVED